MSFSLIGPPLLSRAQVDRDERSRADTEALAEGWRSARVLLVSRRGQFATRGGALALVPATGLGEEPPTEAAVFLGESGGSHLWAVQVPELEGEFTDLRVGGHTLSATDASLATTAVAMLSWQGRSKFAPWSGEPMALGKGGWVRVAPDGKEEFPRTDPAVICLVHDGADQVLLARQPIWPQRWFSVLAGFCEPGESLEQCVEREVSEEVGVEVSDIGYLGSQPWPFPRSLMLGFQAAADPAQPLVLADGEIEEAHWFHLDEVVEALERRHDWGDIPGAPLLLPGSISIARAMIESWAQSRLSAATR
ncbi:MAG: NAD(+) diphosphatase [Segniliparus sp.]|uniref:NAD(+) diphosphatase n=1 Tax=Segniliparus sp. TaxID=2804064 RepID=UPI003F321338